MSCFSRSNWHPAIINWVSSFLSSSVSILNFLSRACWTVCYLSCSLCSLRVASLSAIFYLTCSGVSSDCKNSYSYCLSSYYKRSASFSRLASKSVAFLFLISSTAFLIMFLLILLSVFSSHWAFRLRLRSPLRALTSVLSFYYTKNWKMIRKGCSLFWEPKVYLRILALFSTKCGSHS